MTYSYDPTRDEYAFTPARLREHDRRVAMTKDQCKDEDAARNQALLERGSR